RVQDADDRREDFLARQSGQSQIARQFAPQSGQCFRESGHAVELGTVAHAAPLGMVSILLPTPRIATGRLYMTARVHAYPDILIGRWNRQSDDALQFRGNSKLPA